jgi:hypothetical protein
MRYGIVRAWAGVALAGALAGCSSLSLPSFDSSPPPPADQPAEVQFDSRPPGAIATLSDGPSCKTPCALQIVPRPGTSVTFTLERHLPRTIQLQVLQHPGKADYFGNAPTLVDIDPNPVFAELLPAKPVKKARQAAARTQPTQVAAPAETQSAAPSAPASSSPFPPPSQQH